MSAQRLSQVVPFTIPFLIVLLLSPSVASAQQDVIWTNIVNATASGNTLQKTSGCDGCQDSGGVSQQTIVSGTGEVQVSPGSGKELYVGLSHATATPLLATQIDYAFAVYPNNVCEIRELGTWKADCTFVAGDVLKVAIEPGPVVRYYRNGVAIYASSAVPADYPYVLGADLFNLGATVAHAQFVATLNNWTSVDVGDVGVAGSAAFSGNVLTVQGAGADIGGTADAFHFVYQRFSGDGEIVARIDSIQNTQALAKAGVMMRDGLDPGGAHVTLDIEPAGGTDFMQRIVAGGPTLVRATATVSIPYWIKLVRTGHQVAGYVSQDRSAWSLVGSTIAMMSTTLDVGVAVTSHDSRQLNTSTFEGLSLDAASVPSFYTAITNRNVYPKPALPPLGPAGYRFTDPTFGSRMLRVTDELTRPGTPGRSFTAPSAAHQLAWNATSDLFYVRSIDGAIIPYTFDASTMTASRIGPTPTGDGGLTLWSQVEPQFSFLSWNLLFGSRQDPVNDWPIIEQFDFNTLTYIDVLNLGTVAAIQHGTYAGALSSSARLPERLCVLFGGPSQDHHYKVAVFGSNPASAAVNAVVLDSVASTITSNGLSMSTNIPLGVFLHHAWIDQSGRYVMLYTVNQQPVPYYVWDLITNTITAVNRNAGGHDAAGFGWQINQACCTTTSWDAAQWERRALSDPGATTDLITPVLTPQEVYLADHTSWNNARAATLMPVLSSLYRYYNGTYNMTPWRAWDDEIAAVQTNAPGDAIVWRFAHHRSNVAYDDDPSRALYFWYVPIAVISPNGRWAIFTSNWEKTLGPAVGTDIQPGGRYRCDVFLVALQTASTSSTPLTLGNATGRSVPRGH
jgi:hypothetical protein